MDVPILIDDYIAEWADLDDTAYRDAVDGLARTLCHEHRIAHLVRFIMDAVVAPLASDPDRRHKLRDLASQNLAWRARDGFDQLTELLPPRLGHIRCYLVPAVGNHGAGVCIAAGDLAVCVPVDGDAAGWLLPTAAHEYSHTHRAFNQFQPVTIRDNLVFEGLAMILPEEITPWPVQRPPPSAEEEAAFWETTDFDASADDPEAHARYMANAVAYAMATRIVRSYLDRHRVSIVDAHRLSNDELYWNSGYPRVR